MRSSSTAIRRELSIPALVVLAGAAFAGVGRAQEITVQSESGATVKLDSAAIAALPHQTNSVDDHGKRLAFEGVPLRLVLENAGVSFGDSLRGKRLANCLLIEALDGYRVVIALPELDPEFTDRVILLADKADNHPLDARQGPYRIVVPGEKRMARWVRQVRALKIVEVQ